jgi:hypothetical protein
VVVNAVNKDGRTPLAQATMLPNGKKKDKILALLRSEGATEASSSSGNSAKSHATGRDGTRTQQQQAKTPDTQNIHQMLLDVCRISRPEPPVTTGIDISNRIAEWKNGNGIVEKPWGKTFNDWRGETFNEWQEENPHGYSQIVLGAMEPCETPGWCDRCKGFGCGHIEWDSTGKWYRERCPSRCKGPCDGTCRAALGWRGQVS